MKAIKPTAIPHFVIYVYLFLYMFPFPLMGDLGYYLGIPKLMEMLNYGIGSSVLGIEKFERIQMTGSGDTTFDYVMLLSRVIVSILLGLVLYFIFNAKKLGKELLEKPITIYARYFVGLYMLIYGIVKFLDGGQFSPPSYLQLEQTFGESSPMNLMWTFMGFSRWYSMFAGTGEVIGGMLLLFRRTKTIGAMITIGVMANVVMMNMSYDIPVKLFSTHLVLISLFIIRYDLKALFEFFFLNKNTKLTHEPFRPKNNTMRVLRIVAKSIIIAAVPIGTIVMLFMQSSGGGSNKNDQLNGVYKTEIFLLNSDTLPPLTTDSVRWSKLILEDYFSLIVTMDGKKQWYDKEVVADSSLIKLNPRNKEKFKEIQLVYDSIGVKQLYMKGIIGEDSVEVQFHIKTKEDYLLTNRGFHWINEYPFNR